MLKAQVMQSVSDNCSGRKRTVRHVLFQLLGYEKVVSAFFVASDLGLREKKEKIAQAQEKQLKRTQSNEKLEMPSWRTCADAYLFQFKGGERKKHKIVMEARSSLPSNVPAVQPYSARESVETLTLFQNEVEKQLLQAFLGCSPEPRDGSYVYIRSMSIARLTVWVGSTVRCLVKKEMRG